LSDNIVKRDSIKKRIITRLTLAFERIDRFCVNKQIKKYKQLVKAFSEVFLNALKISNYEKEIPGHELEHSFRVLELATIIGCREKADLLKIILSSLLHDTGRILEEKLGEHHAVISARIAKTVLKNSQFSDHADEISKIIMEHSFSAKKEPTCLESIILRDADMLDALGNIGIARVFAYGGYLGREIYESILTFHTTSLDHFYDKILKLNNRIKTSLGKKLAERRLKKVLDFLKSMNEETDLKELEYIESQD